MCLCVMKYVVLVRGHIDDMVLCRSILNFSKFIHTCYFSGNWENASLSWFISTYAYIACMYVVLHNKNNVKKSVFKQSHTYTKV